MQPNPPIPIPHQPGIATRHGFTESHVENLLRDSLLMAAAWSGAVAALVLQDDSGARYRDSTGLQAEELAALEPTFPKGVAQTSRRGWAGPRLEVIEALPLAGECHQAVGTLYLLAPEPLLLSEAQREGLRLVADHIQAIVAMDQKRSEWRTSPRPPSAASFVPGLVHEMGSFIFGISASLDAFEARFSGMAETGKYVGNIRRSLERMGAFIVELREYGYPQRLSWTVLDLELLFRQVMERQVPVASKNGIGLHLAIEGPLPKVNGDGPGLQGALMRLLDLVLQQEEAGSKVVVSMASGRSGGRAVVSGGLEFPGTRMMSSDLARIFEPFYFRASGLGRLTLPGARRVFESHGGTLTAERDSGGSMRFNFTLPTDLSYSLQAPG